MQDVGFCVRNFGSFCWAPVSSWDSRDGFGSREDCSLFDALWHCDPPRREFEDLPVYVGLLIGEQNCRSRGENSTQTLPALNCHTRQKPWAFVKDRTIKSHPTRGSLNCSYISLK